MRQRADLGWLPQWEGPVKGWARKFLYKNKWRCDPILDADDLLQDAYIVYLKVVDRYPEVREPAHFMSLYQTTLRNEVHTWARQMEDRRGVAVNVEADAPEYTNWGHVAASLSKAPDELKRVLHIFENSQLLAELQYEPKRKRFSRKNLVPRENLNAKLSRLAGLDCNYDVLTALREMFT